MEIVPDPDLAATQLQRCAPSTTALAPPGASLLEMLPNEILGRVVEYIGDRTDDHNDLVQLCATSKRFGPFTTPALYRNVDLEYMCPEVLLRLLRSMLENTALGPFVKQLSLTLASNFHQGHCRPAENLRKWCIHYDINVLDSLTPVQVQDLRHDCVQGPIYSDKEYSPIWSDGHDSEDDAIDEAESSVKVPELHNLVGIACFKILHQTSRLGCLELCLGGIDDHHSHGMLKGPVFTALFGRIQDAILRMQQSTGVDFLANLKTVKLTGSGFDLSDTTGADFTESLPTVFRGLPGLQALIITKETEPYEILRNRGGSTLTPWDAILSLDLTRNSSGFEGSIEPTLLGNISRNFPSLNNLAMRGFLTRMWHCQASTLNLGDTFSSVSFDLEQFPQLEILDLDIQTNRSSRSCVQDNLVHRERLGPGGFLSLKSLHNLQTVKLPFHAIIGHDNTRARVHPIPCPTAVLPASIRNLTLRADFEDLVAFFPRRVFPVTSDPTFDEPWQPRAAILGFLEAISSLGCRVFPHLEEVVYCYSWVGKSFCRCARYLQEGINCEYHERGFWSRYGSYGRLQGGYSEHDADTSPDSGLPSPPLSFESALDEHGAETDILVRFEALVGSFAAKGVRLRVEKREYDWCDARQHSKRTQHIRQ